MPPSINTQITIDSTNKYLDVWDADDGAQLVTLTEQTYDDIVALCAAIQAGLQALVGGSANWSAGTCAVDYTTSPAGKVVINSNQSSAAVSILWKTGDHGADNDDDHVGHILGFKDTGDDTGAYSYTSDYQCQYAWFPARAPVRYGPSLPRAIGGDMRISLDGTNSCKVHIDYQHGYEVVLAELVPELVFAADATSTNTNRDFETQWQYMVQGDWFRWREDRSVEGTSTDYFLIEPMDWAGAVVRPHVDYESYNLTLTFREKET